MWIEKPRPEYRHYERHDGMSEWMRDCRFEKLFNSSCSAIVSVYISSSANNFHSLPAIYTTRYKHTFIRSYIHINMNLKIIFIDILSIFGAIKILWLWMVFRYCFAASCLNFHCAFGQFSRIKFFASYVQERQTSSFDDLVWFLFHIASSKIDSLSCARAQARANARSLFLENRILCYFVY